MELPATGWSRKYRLRVQGQVDEASLGPLANGVTIDGVRYGSVLATLDRQMPSNAWLTIAIREGKNREVRRIMEHLGHRVGRLIRISYGPFQLGELTEGGIEPVKSRVLADQLGITGGEPDSANDAKPKLRAKAKPKSHRCGSWQASSKKRTECGSSGADIAAQNWRTSPVTKHDRPLIVSEVDLQHSCGGRYGSPLVNGIVLDLFAGTGAIGLEALSRGAAWANFVKRPCGIGRCEKKYSQIAAHG